MSAHADRHPTPFEILHGRDEPPTARTMLCAGPLELLLSREVDLRMVRAGDAELVRRVFVTVRDKDWLEVLPQLSDLAVDAHESSFRVSFVASYSSAPLRVTMEGLITGDPSGTITYLLNGVAEASFLFCRIGFCVLHPPSCAGKRYRASTPNGIVEGTLPEHIGVQEFDGQVFHGLFEPFDRLTIQQEPHADVEFAFDGDLFEMEDQRNWTDGSFKTYCTPGYLGYPFRAEPGKRFHQQVVITPSIRPAVPGARRSPARPTITLGNPTGVAFPKRGASLSHHELSERDAGLLRSLRLDHVKVALELSDLLVGDSLAQAEREAHALGAALELAIFLSGEKDGGLHRLTPQLFAMATPIARILVFHEREETTSADRLRIVRDVIAPVLPGVPICGGTNLYFTELNRTRPDLAVIDGVAWTINPQIHASDEASLVETLEAQGETARSARSFSDALPLIVSGITLKPPFNADAMDTEEEEVLSPLPGQLPANVDTRQISLFGAAWTLGSFKYLAENGVSSVTYYETSGWCGLIETEEDSPPASGFPSFPGMVYPLYHVLADAADISDDTMLTAVSSHPLRAVGLAARSSSTLNVLIANLEPREQAVGVQGLPPGEVRTRYLDDLSARLAASDHERFRSSWSDHRVDFPGGELLLELRAYAVARLEIVV